MQINAMLRHRGGFTLVELIVTIVLVAILAVYAIPKFVNSDIAAARTAQDTVLVAARRAQQMAMDKGNIATVQLITDNSNHRARISYVEGGAQTIDFALPSELTVTDAVISYDVLGNATPATTLSVGGGRNVCIEATGYVYQC